MHIYIYIHMYTIPLIYSAMPCYPEVMRRSLGLLCLLALLTLAWHVFAFVSSPAGLKRANLQQIYTVMAIDIHLSVISYNCL